MAVGYFHINGTDYRYAQTLADAHYDGAWQTYCGQLEQAARGQGQDVLVLPVILHGLPVDLRV